LKQTESIAPFADIKTMAKIQLESMITAAIFASGNGKILFLTWSIKIKMTLHYSFFKIIFDSHEKYSSIFIAKSII
jgi:hypothetical protein